jgi:hypothetical protein
VLASHRACLVEHSFDARVANAKSPSSDTIQLGATVQLYDWITSVALQIASEKSSG